MASIKIRNKDDLEHWLKDQPLEVAKAIAIRVAMRAIPALKAWFEESKGKSPPFFLPTFHAIATSWLLVAVESNQSDHDDKLILVAAATATTRATASFASAAATAAAGRSVLAAAIAAASAAADRASFADVVTFSETFATETAIWDSLEEDARFLLAQEGVARISSLMEQPLWLFNMPKALHTLWTSMKRRLEAHKDEHWEVWTNWYDARLDPSRKIPCYSPPIPELERARVLLPKEIWESGPAVANAEIKRLIEEHGCAAGQNIENNDDKQPLVPKQETATIEVEWIEDRLVLRKRPVEADASTLATLQALGRQLQDLRNTLVRQDNTTNAIDRRIIEEIEKVENLIPTDVPVDESQLIQLAMQVNELRTYFESMSEDERLAWPEILRRKLEAQLGVLHTFLGQFRTWEKVHAKDAQELSEEEVQAAPDIAEEVAYDLEELGEERVDPQIISLLHDLKEHLAEALQMVQRFGRVARERAADLWESINNIAKAIGGWLVRKANVFGKALDKAIDGELEKLARQLAKWGRRIVVSTGHSAAPIPYTKTFHNTYYANSGRGAVGAWVAWW